jgi:hypothetical protein
MSGLGELGGLPQFIPGMGGQVSQRDLDQYDSVTVQNPSVDGSWIGTTSGTGPASGIAVVVKNAYMDWPRNALYAINGITNGTYGGTFTANWLDQFGSAVTETVTIGTAVNGGSTFGTAIVERFLSGTFRPIASAGTFIGTASIGVGTVTSGTFQNNWFGLMSKIGAVSDVKLIKWINSGTVANLANSGTGLGTQVSLANHAFQGTSNVVVTDVLTAVFKPTYDNNGKGTMSGL